MFPWPTRKPTDNPLHMLWHYASGRMPDWLNGDHGEVGWVKREHRGVQWLDKITLPKKSQHLKYITHPKFTIKYDSNFAKVLAACGDLSRQGKTWITPELATAYQKLYDMGFAHSYEAWDGAKLVAGAFGLQIGAVVSIDSVFHHVSNAGMAVYGQTLLRLRDRGFKLVDINYVSAAFARFGEEWMPQWKFEALLKEYSTLTPALCDDRPAPVMPAGIQRALPIGRLVDKLKARIWNPYTPSSAVVKTKTHDVQVPAASSTPEHQRVA